MSSRTSPRPRDLVGGESPEYHLARLTLLLTAFCPGPDDALVGLTKLAKLDFLLRYPVFLERLLHADGIGWPPSAAPSPAERQAVESHMIRYKFGPWDDRYYSLVGQMIARTLAVPGAGPSVSLRPTPRGRTLANQLATNPEWRTVAERCLLLASHYDLPGRTLRNRIYQDLPDAVDPAIGDLIPGPTRPPPESDGTAP